LTIFTGIDTYLRVWNPFSRIGFNFTFRQHQVIPRHNIGNDPIGIKMIVAGLKLTLLGMTVVFFFLMLLILFIKISFRFLSAGSVRELAEMEAAALNVKKRSHIKADDNVLVAIISAAIAAHRARKRRVR
jgi:sodium pump decarboxylase gamma subunit